MRRLGLPALIALSLILVSQATPAINSGAISQGPAGLRAFLLRADEPLTHAYARTRQWIFPYPWGVCQVKNSRSSATLVVVWNDCAG